MRIAVSALVGVAALALAGPSLAGRVTLRDVVRTGPAGTVTLSVRW